MSRLGRPPQRLTSRTLAQVGRHLQGFSCALLCLARSGDVLPGPALDWTRHLRHPPHTRQTSRAADTAVVREGRYLWGICDALAKITICCARRYCKIRAGCGMAMFTSWERYLPPPCRYPYLRYWIDLTSPSIRSIRHHLSVHHPLGSALSRHALEARQPESAWPR
ncbi:hypothetical protein F4824DRAFT_22464 [Ustulina deusta]|nr:hypothetical protein F4823DRAFT_297641 [Ustulina deusta]KAI3343833.1 hypothetical protein F4824DRAFT_22464 [Ustulina deusta]